MAGQCIQCGQSLPDPGQVHVCVQLAGTPAPSRVPELQPEWVIAGSVGALVGILLASVVAWRLADTSLLPTVESLGGPDPSESAVPLPPPPPQPEPAASGDEEALSVDEVAIDPNDDLDLEPAESASAASPEASSAPAASVTIRGTGK